MKKSEEKYWLGIKLIDELNNHYNQLLEFFGSPETVWRAGFKELLSFPKLNVDKVSVILAKREEIDLEKAHSTLEKHGIKILTIANPDYPPLLKEIHHPPPVIFVQGELIFDYGLAVAIVGSRRCTTQGRMLAEEFAQGLSGLGITVVSGLARGIDSAAHRGGLKGKGKTIAVTGCGLDIVYPPENRRLFQQISEEGSVISEYPPGTPPLPAHFPVRNRIISGLSNGVLVIEAMEKSGALITAGLALEQNRDVMAVPGNIHCPQNQGANKLLKSGAFLVERLEDILECLNIFTLAPPAAKAPNEELTKLEEKMLEAIGFSVKHLDELTQTTGLSVGEASSLLTMLEVKGLVKREVGNNYLKIH